MYITSNNARYQQRKSHKPESQASYWAIKRSPQVPCGNQSYPNETPYTISQNSRGKVVEKLPLHRKYTIITRLKTTKSRLTKWWIKTLVQTRPTRQKRTTWAQAKMYTNKKLKLNGTSTNKLLPTPNTSAPPKKPPCAPTQNINEKYTDQIHQTAS